MGSTFYIAGILVAILFFVNAAVLWFIKHKKELEDRILGWVCYSVACDRGYIRPGRDENDRIALDYAIKYKKKHSWIVID